MLPFVGPVVSRSSVSRCIASGNKGWACGLVYTRSSYTGPEGGEASLVAGDLGTFAFGLPRTENICLMHTKSDCLFLRIYHQLGMVMSSSPSVRLRQSNASVRIPQMEYPEDTAKRVWDVILHFEVFTYRERCLDTCIFRPYPISRKGFSQSGKNLVLTDLNTYYKFTFSPCNFLYSPQPYIHPPPKKKKKTKKTKNSLALALVVEFSTPSSGLLLQPRNPVPPIPNYFGRGTWPNSRFARLSFFF